ncbi:MAG TPA: helix-hairpin-helix domain-containing protein [Candidatus Kapabacteria bacterium]|nr:helix-hairpin-helix domain-containing protein [Candidatus Kapabacteria bacterium]
MATFIVCVLAGSALLRVWNVWYPAKASVPHAFSAIDSVFTVRTAAMTTDAGCGVLPDDTTEEVFSTDKPLKKKSLPALGSVNLNTASIELLEELPSVGPAMAERITAFRKNTPFRSVAELRRVRGIGRKKFERIEPYVKAE